VSDALGEPEPDARIEVVRGGRVTAEQLAAVVVALSPVVVDDAAARAAVDGPPAWARAALLEGVGLLPPSRPSDLQLTWMLG
jgi:hypothetical protein